MKQNAKIGAVKVLAVLGVAGMGVLLLTYASIRQSSREFVEISKLTSETSMDGRRIKATGKVVKDTPNYNPNTFKLTFTMKDQEGNTTRVNFEGSKPDAFREGGTVIVSGTYNREKNKIKASNLTAKCPSRYDQEFSKKQKGSYQNNSSKSYSEKNPNP